MPTHPLAALRGSASTNGANTYPPFTLHSSWLDLWLPRWDCFISWCEKLYFSFLKVGYPFCVALTGSMYSKLLVSSNKPVNFLGSVHHSLTNINNNSTNTSVLSAVYRDRRGICQKWHLCKMSLGSIARKNTLLRNLSNTVEFSQYNWSQLPIWAEGGVNSPIPLKDSANPVGWAEWKRTQIHP